MISCSPMYNPISSTWSSFFSIPFASVFHTLYVSSIIYRILVYMQYNHYYLYTYTPPVTIFKGPPSAHS